MSFGNTQISKSRKVRFKSAFVLRIGIEHLILSGGTKTLKNSICKTVLIEVNDDFSDQADETMRILSECGFSLKDKYHQAGKIYNQVWVKD